MSTQLKCPLKDHEDNEIVGFCINGLCKTQRLVCFECMKQDTHREHRKDLLKTRQIHEWNQEQATTKQKVNVLMKNIEQLLELLKCIMTETTCDMTFDLQTLNFDQFQRQVETRLKIEYLKQYIEANLHPIQGQIQDLEKQLSELLAYIGEEKQRKTNETINYHLQNIKNQKENIILCKNIPGGSSGETKVILKIPFALKPSEINQVDIGFLLLNDVFIQTNDQVRQQLLRHTMDETLEMQLNYQARNITNLANQIQELIKLTVSEKQKNYNQPEPQRKGLFSLLKK